MPDTSYNPEFWNQWTPDQLTSINGGPFFVGPVVKSNAVCNGCAEMLNTSVGFYNTFSAVNGGTTTSLRITHTPGQ